LAHIGYLMTPLMCETATRLKILLITESDVIDTLRSRYYTFW